MAWHVGRPVGIYGATIAFSFLLPRSRTGWRRGEKKAEQQIAQEYVEAVLAEFSGYIAADELYDGPFCVLSIVDNRTFRRITFEVLDHAPKQADIERFFRKFQRLLEARGLKLRGITTDGSNLYPQPISAVFGDVPHQSCEFHLLKELSQPLPPTGMYGLVEKGLVFAKGPKGPNLSRTQGEVTSWGAKFGQFMKSPCFCHMIKMLKMITI